MNFKSSKFRIIREVGRGGMATVFLAKHFELNKFVAVKILNKETIADDEYVKRFFREARITASLDHPNIVKIIESDFSDGQFYIITEFIDGGDLSSIINSTPLSLRKKLSILTNIVSAIDYAHEKGIVHRDIKPSNILLSKEYKPKLCDFGIATALWGQESRLTQTNQLMGTMDYIAPEQKENSKNVDFRADIYSIGVVLYKIITGRKPIGAFKRPIEINNSISNDLDSIIIKCLQPLPSDRFKNTNNLYMELKNVLRDMDSKTKGIGFSKNTLIVEEKTIIDKDDFDRIIEKLKNGTLSEKLNSKPRFLQIISDKHKGKLLELLENSEGMLKELVIEAIGKLKITESCELLIELLNDSYYNKFVAKALGEINCKGAEKSLLNILLSNKEDSYIALKPLGQLNSKKSIKPMQKYLKSDIEWIREIAIESLGMIDDESVIDYIEHSANRDQNSDIRAKAKLILRRREK